MIVGTTNSWKNILETKAMTLQQLIDTKYGFQYKGRVATILSSKAWQEVVGTYKDDKDKVKEMVGKYFVLHFLCHGQETVLVSTNPQPAKLELTDYEP